MGEQGAIIIYLTEDGLTKIDVTMQGKCISNSEDTN